MKIIDDYNACELVRAALTTLAKSGENQKNPSLLKLVSHLSAELDDLQPKILSVQGLRGFVLTTNIDPWLKAPVDFSFGTRAVAIVPTCGIQPDDGQRHYDLDLSQFSLSDEDPHSDE